MSNNYTYPLTMDKCNYWTTSFEDAHEQVQSFLQYNVNTVERELFYQALNVVLEIELDDELDLDDYEHSFRRMFGNERMDAVYGSMEGTVRFYGLTPTSMKSKA